MPADSFEVKEDPDFVDRHIAKYGLNHRCPFCRSHAGAEEPPKEIMT